MRSPFKFPEEFQQTCAANTTQAGCRPWLEHIQWGGGGKSTQRFENFWDEPYVFAVVVDAKGYWIYRWRTKAYDGKTGWPGVDRFAAQRQLPPRPTAVKDPRGLRTDVSGDVAEAVILQPSLSPEAVCLRSSLELVTWQWGTDALAAMAQELGEIGPGSKFEGVQNWWSNFADTGQNANYPPSIMGLETKNMTERLDCNDESTFACSCAARRREEILHSDSQTEILT
eukprot:Skav219882  [mRNA]  locus=scaffold777:399809:400489:- [translate_table: standard]